MSRFLFTLCCLFTVLGAEAQSTVTQQLTDSIPVFMQRDRIPGLSIAYLEAGRPVWVRHYGVASQKTGAPITDSTRFEAASLTKVVTAYTAMLLICNGQLDLDKPLAEYLGNNYDVDDPRFAGVTARRVLSHTAGFPNWRSSSKLTMLFSPGEKFQYSGEGFVLLSKVMEKITRQSFPQLLQDSVFTPLGMRNSNIIFDTIYRQLHVPRHNWLGKPRVPPIIPM